MKTVYSNTLRCGLVLAGLALLALVASAQKEDPKAILAKAREHYAHARTYQGVWQVDISDVVKSDTSKTASLFSARYEVKQTGEKFRIEGYLKGVMGDAQDELDALVDQNHELDTLVKDIFSTGMRPLMVSDGHICYLVMLGAKEGFYKKLPADMWPGSPKVLAELMYQIGIVGSKSILLPWVVLDGRPTYVVETVKDNNSSDMVIYYIDQETYRIEKMTATSAILGMLIASQATVLQMTSVFRDEKLGAPILDDGFEFTPPMEAQEDKEASVEVFSPLAMLAGMIARNTNETKP